MLALLLLLAIPAAAETVEIVRDAYGNPHIFAETSAGAVFGAGYAQAQDRGEALLTNLLTHGDEKVDASDSGTRLATAFARGVNAFFHDHPENKAPAVSATDVLLYSRWAYSSILGSNDLLVSGSRTLEHSVIAILDPVVQVNGPTRPYEMTLYAKKEDLAIAGVAPVGVPFPIVGHTQFLSIGWSGDPKPGSTRTLDEAWALITSHTLADAQKALAMNQIRGQVLIGTSAGEIYDSSGAKPTDGYLRRAGPSPEGDAVVKEALRVQTTWSFGRVQNLAFDTTVYGAEEWQKLLARVDPGHKLSKRIIGWNRRADVDSADAVAFYFFKLALGRDATQIKPPDSLSTQRLYATLDRARELLETKVQFNAKSNPTWDSTWGATWGGLFRMLPDGVRAAVSLSGGDLPEAGMFTPRAWTFAPGDPKDPAARRLAISGPLVTRVVELSSKPTAVAELDPGKGTTKRTFFRDRKELEKSSAPAKRLIFPNE